MSELKLVQLKDYYFSAHAHTPIMVGDGDENLWLGFMKQPVETQMLSWYK
jgi:hypothetical protein